jgi:uncharacterized cupin superfamily protein
MRARQACYVRLVAERPNVFDDDWERSVAHGGFALRGNRVGAAAGSDRLGLGVFELPPRKRNLPYHAHFGIEELLIVLRGHPTLRTPDGERELAEGEVVVFLPGRGGAHQLINATDEPVRYLMVSTSAGADVIEYPDSGKIAAQGGEWGAPEAVAYLLSTERQVGYFDGEPQ